MKAVVHSSYGAPDALELNGIDRPVDRSSEASRSSSSGPRVGWAASRCSWAKAFGAQVTAVCSTRRADLVGSIGADQVIDSTQGTAPGRGGAMAWSWSWLGTVRWRRCGVRSPQRGRWCWWAGRVVGGCRGPVAPCERWWCRRLWASGCGRCCPSRGERTWWVLKQLIEAGKVTPVIDRSFPLSQTPGAIRYVGERSTQDKTVIPSEGGPLPCFTNPGAERSRHRCRPCPPTCDPILTIRAAAHL
jgi:Zinc-binding dehydrogenase